jgi:hypothetical protein
MVVAGAGAPEEMVGIQPLLMLRGVLEVVALSSMAATVQTREALAHTSAAAQVAAKATMVITPLAPEVEAVEADCTVAASSIPRMEATAPMEPTVAAGVAGVSASTSRANPRAAVVEMEVLAAAVAPQDPIGLSSVAVMEEMVDLEAAQASASVLTLISTANPETLAVSEEVATAVAVAVGAELSEARSSTKAVSLSSATVPSPTTMWIGERAGSTPKTPRTERAMAGTPARRSSP